MKKLLIVLLFLATIAIGASSCFLSKSKPCPAYYSSTQTTQTTNIQPDVAH